MLNPFDLSAFVQRKVRTYWLFVTVFFFAFSLFHSWQLFEWYPVCPALFSARPSKACRIARVALHVIPRPSIASTRCLSDKHSRCWHYQMLSACRPPLAFALLWLLDEVSGLATWLWVTEEARVCVRVGEQAWLCMSMLQIDLPLVCHIRLALYWPPRRLQAAPYITQLSLATRRTVFMSRQKEADF